MTLAERIVDHCTPANRVDGYGSLMGATLPLRRLVDRFFGRRFEIATGPRERGKGYGKRVVLSALRWARLRGAQQAWLQVEASNHAALRLYDAIGFKEVYRYHYRRPPGT